MSAAVSSPSDSSAAPAGASSRRARVSRRHPTAKADEPRRLRWSVPRADESTNRWLDVQHDISRSLQVLIRESIQRDGFIDMVNRPIEQLPRRGRPPQSDSDADADLGIDSEAAPSAAAAADADAPIASVASAEQAVAFIASDTADVTTPETDDAPEPREDVPAAPAVPAPATVPASGPGSRSSVPSGLDAFLT